jgi:pimeloyl-ACP methyl ester carboxylesterase
LGDLPLIALSSACANPRTLAEHKSEACLSTRGKHRVVAGTGHWINLDAPDEIVEAVRSLLG